MKYSVTGKQMKQIDADTIDRIGIPAMVLMERAALAVAEAAECLSDGRPVRVWAACGMGNNGADGIAAGRILHEKGYDVTVILTGNPDYATAENRQQQRIAGQLGLELVEFGDFIPGKCDVIIDAVFGVGLSRPVAGEAESLLKLLAGQSGSRVVAVDIPSGIHADTGQVLGTALKASVTVTFGYRKTGLLLFPGQAYTGKLQVVDIGFSAQSLKKVGWDARILEPADLKNLPVRAADANKGTYGKLLIIAGSAGMSGAAFLSARGAYRTGAGLVKILTVEENRQILQSQLPEAIVETYETELLTADRNAFYDMVASQCDWATAIILGPGLGQDPYSRDLVEAVLTYAYVPMVLDADALNTLAMYSELTGYFTENIIVTPHMGEMMRLTGLGIAELKENPVEEARNYSVRHGITCVLKDAATIIADKEGEVCVNTSGSSGMAKAGAGDVLTGMIGGLLAQGMELNEAASYGVYLHGLAGEAAVEERGMYGVLAHEIADCVGQVIRKVTKTVIL